MTLTELKKSADKYLWIGSSHPLSETMKPEFKGAFFSGRKVKVKQTNSIQFENGSWLTWPKASECCFFMSGGELCFSINFAGSAMTYTLREIESEA